MPGYDGTGPRGTGMFTGRGEGYCALRLPEAGSGEAVSGYAGIAGQPVQLPPGAAQHAESSTQRHSAVWMPASCARVGAARCGRRK